MKLLHIDTSIQSDNSVSRQMSRAAVDRLRGEIPNLEVAYRDFAVDPLAHLTGSVFAAHIGDSDATGHDDATARDIRASKAALEDFQTADIVVLGVPLYNYSVPSTLRSWFDRIVVVGKTFRYLGPNNVMGLAEGKRVIVLLSRGGTFGDGSPVAHHEHAETYIRSIFTMVGINDVEFIVAEGVAMSPENRQAALQSALKTIQTLAA